MTTINDGGPAFPFGQISEITGQPINGYFAPGMSLRDWLAAHATDADIAAIRARHEHELGTKITREQVRYIHADAMLRAREVKP